MAKGLGFRDEGVGFWFGVSDLGFRVCDQC